MGEGELKKRFAEYFKSTEQFDGISEILVDREVFLQFINKVVDSAKKELLPIIKSFFPREDHYPLDNEEYWKYLSKYSPEEVKAKWKKWFGDSS